MSQTISKHPAKYSDIFIPVFAKILSKYDCHKILDPFAGIGKITEMWHAIYRFSLETVIYTIISFSFCKSFNTFY